MTEHFCACEEKKKQNLENIKVTTTRKYEVKYYIKRKQNGKSEKEKDTSRERQREERQKNVKIVFDLNQLKNLCVFVLISNTLHAFFFTVGYLLFQIVLRII